MFCTEELRATLTIALLFTVGSHAQIDTSEELTTTTRRTTPSTESTVPPVVTEPNNETTENPIPTTTTTTTTTTLTTTTPKPWRECSNPLRVPEGREGDAEYEACVAGCEQKCKDEKAANNNFLDVHKQKEIVVHCVVKTCGPWCYPDVPFPIDQPPVFQPPTKEEACKVEDFWFEPDPTQCVIDCSEKCEQNYDPLEFDLAVLDHTLEKVYICSHKCYGDPAVTYDPSGSTNVAVHGFAPNDHKMCLGECSLQNPGQCTGYLSLIAYCHCHECCQAKDDEKSKSTCSHGCYNEFGRKWNYWVSCYSMMALVRKHPHAWCSAKCKWEVLFSPGRNLNDDNVAETFQMCNIMCLREYEGMKPVIGPSTFPILDVEIIAYEYTKNNSEDFMHYFHEEEISTELVDTTQMGDKFLRPCREKFHEHQIKEAAEIKTLEPVFTEIQNHGGTVTVNTKQLYERRVIQEDKNTIATRGKRIALIEAKLKAKVQDEYNYMYGDNTFIKYKDMFNAASRWRVAHTPDWVTHYRNITYQPPQPILAPACSLVTMTCYASDVRRYVLDYYVYVRITGRLGMKRLYEDDIRGVLHTYPHLKALEYVLSEDDDYTVVARGKGSIVGNIAEYADVNITTHSLPGCTPPSTINVMLGNSSGKTCECVTCCDSCA